MVYSSNYPMSWSRSVFSADRFQNRGKSDNSVMQRLSWFSERRRTMLKSKEEANTMTVFGIIKEKIGSIKDKAKESAENAKAFKNDKRIIGIRVLKGNREKKNVIFSDGVFYFYGDKKDLCIDDVIVTFRNDLFIINQVDGPIEYEVGPDGERKTVLVTKALAKRYENPKSIRKIMAQSSNQTANVSIKIDSINNSSIDNVANIAQDVSQTQDIYKKWDAIKSDLDLRYDFETYKKFIDGVDRALSEKEPSLISEKETERVGKALGAFFGGIVAGFVSSLIKNSQLWGN